MRAQRVLFWLVVGALGLPIVLCVLYAVARLLEAMQDRAGAECLGRASLALFIVWVVDLLALLIVQAISSLGGPPGSHHPQG